MYKNLRIEKQGTIKSKEFLALHDKMTQDGASICNGHCYGLYDTNNVQVGVAVFHMVSAWQTVKGCFSLENMEQKGFWELGRLVMDAAHDTDDCKSWFLVRCIDLLTAEVDVRALFAYVNSEVETGSYLPPAGFKYFGLTMPRTDFYVKQADGSYKKQSRGKTKGIDGKWLPRPRKHRYLLTFDNRLKSNWDSEPIPTSVGGNSHEN